MTSIAQAPENMFAIYEISDAEIDCSYERVYYVAMRADGVAVPYTADEAGFVPANDVSFFVRCMIAPEEAVKEHCAKRETELAEGALRAAGARQ